FADASNVAGNTTDGNIIFVGFEIGHQLWPRRLYVLDLYAQDVGHGFNDIDVVAFVPAGVGFDGERPVVAWRSHPQSFGFHNSIQPWPRMSCRGNCDGHPETQRDFG